MPDISMCSNHECEKAESCYRYRAVPGQRQSFANFGTSKGGCKSHWPIEGYSEHALQSFGESKKRKNWFSEQPESRTDSKIVTQEGK